MSRLPRISLNFSDCPLHMQDYFLEVLSRRYEILREDRPDFLIYALTGHRHRLHNCTKIYVHHETYRPNWKECDYAVLPFRSADPRQFYLPIYAFGRPADPLLRSGREASGWLEEKKRFCCLLSSYEDRSVRSRMAFFHALNRRRKVDSLGRAANNVGFRIPGGHQAKLDALRPYRFTIAFENKDLAGWTTEKMYDPFCVGTIPIFWGDPWAVQDFNPEAFVNAYDFPDWDALADQVIRIDEDAEAYRRMLRAPPFRDNRPSEHFDEGRLLDFFEEIFRRRSRPVAQTRWFFHLTKWRLAKRNKLSTE